MMCGPQKMTDGVGGEWWRQFSPCPLLFSSPDPLSHLGSLSPPSRSLSLSLPDVSPGSGCPVANPLFTSANAVGKKRRRRRRVGGDYLQSALATCIPSLSVTSEGVLHLSCNYLRKYVENCEAAHIRLIIWSCRQADGRPTVALMT